MYQNFLPLSKEEMLEKGWQYVDFVVVTGDAYVDHPSFGSAIISRVLENEGYKVGIISQPNFNEEDCMALFGKPRYAYFIGGGNVDSMVAHYSVSKKRRTQDEYTPGKKMGKRPDRCVNVYTKLAKQKFPDIPVIIGGLEASLRRFAHYDYWDDTVMPSVLQSSGADLLTFGMGERQTVEIAKRLAGGEDIANITNISGTCFMANFNQLPATYTECASFTKVSADKISYAKATRIQLDNQDAVSGKAVVQKHGDKYVVQNLPAKPLVRKELDELYALPFTRTYHPSYEKFGGISAIEEVEFSIIHNRGCFGGCNFCAIQLHQGRNVTSRSEESVVKEAKLITTAPNFKGYIHDIGGPTANFRKPSCKIQITKGMCKGGKKCLAPTACANLIVDHTDYLNILRRVRNLPKVKKVFIRSGIRYDYIMRDKNDDFFNELVEHHVSGQLKVAPEHCAVTTLNHMGKPGIDVYNKFAEKFYKITKKCGKKQFLVPYLISSHPGSTLKDAVLLAEYLYKNNIRPEQVQDFYPTPGTVSTCMYYTGLNPYTLKEVYVARTKQEKTLQRALLQYYDIKNSQLVKQALELTNRTDLLPKLIKSYTAKGQNLNGKTQPAKGNRYGSNEGVGKKQRNTSKRPVVTGKHKTETGAKKWHSEKQVKNTKRRKVK